MLAMFWAILSPLMFALMNVFDKVILDRRIKSTPGYIALSGVVSFVLGAGLALIVSWKGVLFSDLLWSALAGLVFGIPYFLYFRILSKDDVSHAIGIMYVYPVLVAILSWLFLGEVLSLSGYLAVLLIIVGAILLTSTRIKLKSRALLVLALIFSVACGEFLVKVVTTIISLFNGIAMTHMFIGVMVCSSLFVGTVRKGFVNEFHNIRFAFITEILTLLGMITLFFAMKSLPATIVSSAAAIQPLFVLGLEALAVHAGFIKDLHVDWKSKVVPIALIIVGVVLLQ